MESAMQVRVLREACCSQDDQLGPLEAAYDLEADSTILDLVRAVVRSQFLQFSSTHLCLTGFVGGAAFVKVCESDHGPAFAQVFLVASDLPLAPFLSSLPVTFRFT